MEYNTSDKLAIALACLAGVMAIILFLIEKTPATVLFLLLSMFALCVYPILHFAKRVVWRGLAFVGFGIGTLLFGWYVWPHNHPIASSAHTENTPVQRLESKPAETKAETKLESKPSPTRDANRIARLKNPLEVVSFDSSSSITIANNGPLSVYVVSLGLKSEQGISSYELGFDIEPGKFYKHPFSPPSKTEGALHPGEEHFRLITPLPKLADTWDEHFRKATGLFQKCGMMLLYFSPSDPAFLQMKDAYSWKPERPLVNLLGLGYGDASGILYYRVKGFTETKEQSVPLVVTVAVDGDKCPHIFPVPYTPTQSHP